MALNKKKHLLCAIHNTFGGRPNLAYGKLLIGEENNIDCGKVTYFGGR